MMDDLISPVVRSSGGDRHVKARKKVTSTGKGIVPPAIEATGTPYEATGRRGTPYEPFDKGTATAVTKTVKKKQFHVFKVAGPYYEVYPSMNIQEFSYRRVTDDILYTINHVNLFPQRDDGDGTYHLLVLQVAKHAKDGEIVVTITFDNLHNGVKFAGTISEAVLHARKMLATLIYTSEGIWDPAPAFKNISFAKPWAKQKVREAQEIWEEEAEVLGVVGCFIEYSSRVPSLGEKPDDISLSSPWEAFQSDPGYKMFMDRHLDPFQISYTRKSAPWTCVSRNNICRKNMDLDFTAPTPTGQLEQGLNSYQLPLTPSAAAAAAASGGTLPPGITGTNERCTILASNLNPEKLDADKIFNLFSNYGNIMRIKLLHNKPDHALVQMGDGFQAELAVCYLRGTLLFGKRMEVNFSKHPQINPSQDTHDYSSSNLNRFNRNALKNYKYCCAPTRMMHVSSLPLETQENDLVAHLSPHGRILNVKMFEANGKKQALVQFDNEEQATEALVCKHATLLKKATIRLAFSKLSNI